jgi:hypothetical protein
VVFGSWMSMTVLDHGEAGSAPAPLRVNLAFLADLRGVSFSASSASFTGPAIYIESGDIARTRRTGALFRVLPVGVLRCFTFEPISLARGSAEDVVLGFHGVVLPWKGLTGPDHTNRPCYRGRLPAALSIRLGGLFLTGRENNERYSGTSPDRLRGCSVRSWPEPREMQRSNHASTVSGCSGWRSLCDDSCHIPHSWGKTLVQVAITNHQHTAIMEDRGLFKMEDHDANIYDPSDLPGGMEYFLGQEQGLFLRQINPGVTVIAWLAFETPGTLDVSHSLRAGMTGKASSMEMTVNRQVPPSQVSPACDGKWHRYVVGETPDPCTYY